MFVVLLANLYTSRIVLQNIGVSDFGIYNVVAGFICLFSFFNVSLSNGVQRFYNYSMGKNDFAGLKKIFSSALCIHFFLAVLIFIIAMIVGQIYIDKVMVVPAERIGSTKIIYMFALISFAVTMIQIPFSAVAIAFERMNFFAFVGLLDAGLKLLIAFAISWCCWDKLEFYVFLLMIISLFDFTLYYLYSKRIAPGLKFGRTFSKKDFVDLISFSGWNVIGTFSFTIRNQGSNLLLNVFFGPAVNAANGIANQVMSAVQNFSVNMLTAFRPQLVQSYAEGNFLRFQKLFFWETKSAYFLLLIIVIPLSIEIDFVLSIWLGKTFVPDHTALFVRLVFVLMMLGAIHQPLTQVIQANGNQKFFQITNFIFMTLVLPIAYLFLHMEFEPYVVFLISIILMLLNVFSCVIVVHKMVNFDAKRYIKNVLLPCICGTFVLPLIPLLISNQMNPSLTRLLCVCISDFLVAVMFLYVFVLTVEERKTIKSFIKKRLTHES
jgi:O-antigen/teichoic acid export membrane protein